MPKSYYMEVNDQLHAQRTLPWLANKNTVFIQVQDEVFPLNLVIKYVSSS
jgi:hypothetical protein